MKPARIATATEARFWQLREWLEGLGLCPLCATTLAEMQVQIEAGNARPRTDDTGCRKDKACFPLGRRNWHAMPGRSP